MDLQTVTNQAKQLAGRVKLGQLGSVADLPFNLKTLYDAGVVRPMGPGELAAVAAATRRWGASPAAGISVSATIRPDRVAVIDELGEITFAEVERHSNSLARALADRGVGGGDPVALMCRNHRGFVEALFACSKLGATVLLMNTDFAGPQLEGVVEREQPKALLYDSEFTKLLEAAGNDLPRIVSFVEDGDETGEAITATETFERYPDEPLDPPEETSRFIVLTSGTTGTPKGAQRNSPDSLAPLAIMLSKIPLQSEERTMIAAPMFHSWGFMHFTLGLALGSTYVLRRGFDPEDTMRLVDEHDCQALAAVPVMLQRILELGEETLSNYDTSSLRVTAASGSALPGEMALRWMDATGDNLYNLYGSTEVAWASIATPEDMRDAPGTAGYPPRNTVVKIYDENDELLPQGETGRIFVGNEMQFEGYTGGEEEKDYIDGLISSGDVGYFDEKGRLFVEGRDDDMIVSGGENVFPREVEDLLADHSKIDEAAVIGVDDEEFGQRLKAFVVTTKDHELSEDEVKGHVKENLARYKIPREVEFLDELPRNPTGKVLKKELE
ncbi:MAG: acyl-CoA synthetase [Solirubrobacterales bacterium]